MLPGAQVTAGIMVFAQEPWVLADWRVLLSTRDHPIHPPLSNISHEADHLYFLQVRQKVGRYQEARLQGPPDPPARLSLVV